MAAVRPIALASILAHPLGSAFERHLHLMTMPLECPTVGWPWERGAAAVVAASGWWWIGISVRLFFFELVFDGLFYVAHRAVHAWPAVYHMVHKLHHRHTHDLRLLSSLQMSPADVLVTHTLPVAGAFMLVPLAPGLEFSLAKAYLLFQEFYGHAGVEHKVCRIAAPRPHRRPGRRPLRVRTVARTVARAVARAVPRAPEDFSDLSCFVNTPSVSSTLPLLP